MEYVSFGSFLITRLVNIKAQTHFEQNLKALRGLKPLKHTPLYENEQNEREIFPMETTIWNNYCHLFEQHRKQRPSNWVKSNFYECEN